VDNTSSRRWQDIASELKDEHDSRRVVELAEELTVAMDEALGKRPPAVEMPVKARKTKAERSGVVNFAAVLTITGP
jgi:hypothetical protein